MRRFLKGRMLKGSVLFLFMCALLMMNGKTAMAASSATISSCQIVTASDSTYNVQVKGTLSSVSSGTTVYLLAMPAYSTSTSNLKMVGSATVSSSSYTITAPLNANTSSSLLYKKFAVGVKASSGSGYTLLSSGWQYITNPEKIATNTDAYPTSYSKKGLMVADNTSLLEDVSDLGIQHAVINMVVGQLFSTSSSGIAYEYNGTTYYFNSSMMNAYDQHIADLTNRGCTVSVILLNRYDSSYPSELFENLDHKSDAYYYSYNTSTEASLNRIAALMSYLADRYSGSSAAHGRVANWIIGNEVNNQLWNYVNASYDVSKYVENYARSFRVIYNAIKSTAANDRVYISLDHEWNVSVSDNNTSLWYKWYKTRDVLDYFNSDLKAEGNIDWSVAFHCYPIPLSETNFWNDPDYTGISMNWTSSDTEISFANLTVLTDYLKQSSFQYGGSVRHLILSEQGFTSLENQTTMNQRMQAAAYAYAYYLAESNQYVDSFYLAREIDSYAQSQSGYNYGIWTGYATSEEQANTKKYIWNVMRDIDTTKSEDATSFALSLIGVDSWDTALSNLHAYNTSYSSIISKFTKSPVDTSSLTPSVTYQSYIYGSGWNVAVQDGETSGSTGSSKKLEAVSIQLTDQPYDGGISYQSYIYGKGWSSTAVDSDSTGNQGNNVSMTALKIQVTGAMSGHYYAQYRVYVHSSGWTDWVDDGSIAGSTSSSNYIEAVEIKLIEIVDINSKMAIKKMQQRLVDLNYLSATPDGVIGAKTQTALKKFQLLNGLEVTGENNEETYKAVTGSDAIAFRTMKVGDTGSDVKAVQQKLVDLGYLTATPDGSYGNMTKAAMVAFQAENGLAKDSIDGMCGNWTVGVLIDSPAEFAVHEAGDGSNAVDVMEMYLSDLGYFNGTTDTLIALKKFELLNGLTVDGIADQSTLAVLYHDVNAVEFRTMKVGDTGDDVQAVQQYLVDLGYLTATPDGTYGNMTKAAVTAFQAANGLESVDGLCGKWTLGTLVDNPAACTAFETGADSIAVKVMEKYLYDLGYFTGTADTVFDADTETALKKFELLNGLTVDGIADQVTLTTLYHANAIAFRTMKVGNTGDDVKAVQQYLVNLGYLNATPDGSYGNMTKAAVTAFQAANGLENVDGLCGKWTLGTLVASPAAFTSLQKGDSSTAVKVMQKYLVNLKYLSATPDGKFGNMSETALKKFQFLHSLPVTGIADRDTLNKLYHANAVAQKTLSVGSKGDDVKAVQQFLVDHNYLTATPDGSYGNMTKTAVENFQKENGLASPDGKVGNWTLGKMVEVLTKEQEEAAAAEENAAAAETVETAAMTDETPVLMEAPAAVEEPAIAEVPAATTESTEAVETVSEELEETELSSKEADETEISVEESSSEVPAD